MHISFENDSNRFTFTDKWCSSVRTSMINYNIDSRVLFDITDISLHHDSRVVKRVVERKKLFRTVEVEIEETVTDHYILLNYKDHSCDPNITAVKIVLTINELPNAETVVDYIRTLLEKKIKLDEERRIADEERHQELLETEQKRLQQCIYDYVVIDLETTGFNGPLDRTLDGKRIDEVLSVSIIDQDGNVLLNSLCKPQVRKTWAKAQEVHGISPAMVKNKPTFEELFPIVKEILYKAKIVIAYNTVFEMRFLWGFDLEYGKPDGTQLIRNVVWGPDPMLMYSAYKGTEKWQKLSSAAKHFRFEYNAHDSLEDVKATLHCYKRLLEFVAKNPDKAHIIKYGYTYDDGIKGKWLDLNTYQIKQGEVVDYPDVYRNK